MQQLEQIKRICAFLAQVLGVGAEILVHDMQTGEILWIANGEITGRQTGDTVPLPCLRMLAQRARETAEPGQIIGHRRIMTNGASLRSSILFLPDATGEERYSICVNQNVSGLLAFQDWLNTALHAPDHFPQAETPEATVDSLIMDIIYGEIERAKPFSLDSREARLRILRRLNEKGVFEVRRAAPKVCELLQIAQPTLYKYLKEIREE